MAKLSRSRLNVPIGTIVEYKKYKLKVASIENNLSLCRKCFFNNNNLKTCIKNPCTAGERTDAQTVIFIKID